MSDEGHRNEIIKLFVITAIFIIIFQILFDINVISSELSYTLSIGVVGAIGFYGIVKYPMSHLVKSNDSKIKKVAFSFILLCGLILILILFGSIFNFLTGTLGLHILSFTFLYNVFEGMFVGWIIFTITKILNIKYSKL